MEAELENKPLEKVSKTKNEPLENKPFKKRFTKDDDEHSERVSKTEEKIVLKEKTVMKEKEAKLIFDLYDISEVGVKDPGLQGVISLNYSLVIKSHGRRREKFGKANVNIVERLVNSVGVPGHRGKKHKIITGWATGKYNKNLAQVLEAFKIIKEKTGKNPIQILVNAIENGAPMDEVTMIQYGGARYPQAVDTAPLRRISLALRNISHGAYDKSFNKKKTYPQALAEELIGTANNESTSIAVSKKNELEKQADSAR